MPQPVLSVLTWNLWWQSSISLRGRAIRRILERRNADIAVLTEVADSLIDGHSICSQPDYGYRIIGTRRKVFLWSRNAWRDIDEVGDPRLPPGRFIAGTTDTALGPVRVIGVCIPWKDAHVNTGRKDRHAWEDHRQYLEALSTALVGLTGQTIVAGDFNQAVPRSRAPVDVSDALRHTFKQLKFATTGPLPPLDRLAIDHVAHTPDLVSSVVECWSEYDEHGLQLSDHFGIQVKLTCR